MHLNYLKIISSYWDSQANEYHQAHPEHLDETLHPSWGLWHISEKKLNILQATALQDKYIVDLGCGRGHDSLAFGKLGAQVLGVDISRNQIENALKHPNVRYAVSSAENVPVKDCTIDIAISDHGAFDHSPAPLLLLEMKRILKTDGRLIICTYSPLAFVCYDCQSGKIDNRLINDYPNDEIKSDGKIVNVEYSYSSWIKMFSKNGFMIEALEELITPKQAKEYFDDLVNTGWASRWPFEIIWTLRKL